MQSDNLCHVLSSLIWHISVMQIYEITDMKLKTQINMLTSSPAVYVSMGVHKVLEHVR